MLKPEGRLYISFPIANSNEIHFNAHRVFHPRDVLNWAEDRNSLQLERFDYVDTDGRLRTNVDIENTDIDVTYGCGIYTFRKVG
jgi:hypothetical protein